METAGTGLYSICKIHQADMEGVGQEKPGAKLLNCHQKCRRECGSYDTAHKHVFQKCPKITAVGHGV